MSHTDLSREGLLALVRRAWTEHDPVPDGLAERMQAVAQGEAALVEVDLDYELLMLVDRSTELAGARGTAAYTLRFAGADLDLLLRAVTGGDGAARLDGWVAPATACSVGVSAVPDTGRTWEVTSDELGRFEVTGLPPGMYRVFLTPDDTGVRPFGTPAFEI
ncbi:carboxypeptidase-like regulatory domain-containing protein [Nocardioides donggukensis]|uniref:Carboxypeptidase regulatory-like domain-containing protein n=1 Tax=Nocardioides donggukensis TaxID=2774019 RepID=A0A927K6Z6_9ACTN|nr:carboxypeptidase-like regulatory domain-containing protein [Nocardioides donggukensis]MBD8871023.1 carboxypeptidase regulatory-like domain-containing protein [Nocardioides donggukensis]